MIAMKRPRITTQKCKWQSNRLTHPVERKHPELTGLAPSARVSQRMRELLRSYQERPRPGRPVPLRAPLVQRLLPQLAPLENQPGKIPLAAHLL